MKSARAREIFISFEDRERDFLFVCVFVCVCLACVCVNLRACEYDSTVWCLLCFQILGTEQLWFDHVRHLAYSMCTSCHAQNHLPRFRFVF